MLDFTGSLEPRFLRMRSHYFASYITALLRTFPTSLLASTGPVPIRSFLRAEEGEVGSPSSSLVVVFPRYAPEEHFSTTTREVKPSFQPQDEVEGRSRELQGGAPEVEGGAPGEEWERGAP
ncbi:MAG: hypothetical protein SGPRY_007303, partial [Prymnesium sp.]